MKLYRKRAFYGLLKAFIYKKLMIFYVRKLSYINIIKKSLKLYIIILTQGFIMPPLSDSRRGWFSNKLKGDFAENICNTHLSTLDYDVEKVGIENIAPKYAMNMSSFQTNFVVSQLNKTPDFVVSKRNDTAIFVEVKYNSTIDNSDQAFYDYGTALMIRYKE